MIVGRRGDDRAWAPHDRGRARGRAAASLEPAWWLPEPRALHLVIGGGWFLVIVTAMWFGVGPLATVLAATAGLAAGQTARAWDQAGEGADTALALLVAALAPIAAAVHTAALGAVLCAGAVVSLLSATAQRSSAPVPLRAAGFTVQSWIGPAVATGSLVLAHQYEPGIAVWLVALTAIYDAGHYLVGADSSRPWVGVLAGLLGIVVTSFALVMIGVPPLDAGLAVRYALLAAFAIPAGVALAGALLPDPDAPAGALRRIDSLLVAAPLWAFLLGRHLTTLQ